MTGYFQPKEYKFVCELGLGPFLGPLMGENYSNGYVDIEYYDAHPDDGGSLAAPASGELLCEITRSELPNDVNAPWGTMPNGTVNAADLAYERPSWAGSAKYFRVSENIAVVGATHALVRILRT